MQVKLLLFSFYLNGGLHAVSIEKPSKQMSMFWMVRFLKNEYELNFSFPHITTSHWTTTIKRWHTHTHQLSPYNISQHNVHWTTLAFVRKHIFSSTSSRIRVMNHNVVSHETASSPTECSRDKPFSFVRGQDSTMWDIVWVLPQGHNSMSISHHFPSADGWRQYFPQFPDSWRDKTIYWNYKETQHCLTTNDNCGVLLQLILINLCACPTSCSIHVGNFMLLTVGFYQSHHINDNKRSK